MSVIEEVQQEEITEQERLARLLEAAALEIEVRGHAKGTLEDEEGRVCIAGAIGKVRGRGAKPEHVFAHAFPDCQVPHPIAWNDMPERTAEEVTFVLRWRAEEIRDGRW